MTALDHLLECLAVSRLGGELSPATQQFLCEAVSRVVMLDTPPAVAFGFSSKGGAATRRQIARHIRDELIRTAFAAMDGPSPWKRSQSLARALRQLHQGRARHWYSTGAPTLLDATTALLWRVLDHCWNHDLRVPGARAIHDIVQTNAPADCAGVGSDFEQIPQVRSLLDDANAA